MSETLRSKLARILSDEKVRGVEINIKCKTRDGMIYTLWLDEHDRAETTRTTTIPFSDVVHTTALESLLHVMEVVEKGDGYWFSTEEMVAVKHTEIVRIWAELGDLYYDGMPEQA